MPHTAVRRSSVVPFAAFRLGLAALMLTAGSAAAHPRLLSSTPADRAQVAPTARIELHFSEPLEANFSDGRLIMTGMAMNEPMMSAEPKPIALAARTSPGDPKSLVLTAAGLCRLAGIDWNGTRCRSIRTGSRAL